MKIRSLAFAASLFFAGAAACGDDESTDPSGLQTLSVLVDGAQFSAASGGATRAGNTVTLTGTATSGGITRTLTIAVQAAAAGTIAVGGAGSPTITYSEQASGAAAKQWAAGVGSGSGTLVFTELSATKAVGTFLANLPPVTASGALAAKNLSSGNFSLTF